VKARLEKKAGMKKEKKDVIRNYFLGLKRDEQDPEIVEIMDYFTRYRFSILPYEYARRYHAGDIDVYYDASCRMNFVLHDGKKLYFPQNWDTESVQEYYNGLRIEQDEESPHRYETKDFAVEDGEVIADIGAAEGIWALSCAEKAGKIYLFECEKGWIEALQKTFAPWREKVTIVNKCVSDRTLGKKICLDDFFRDKAINVIKADIEGAEVELLEGSQSILSADNGEGGDIKLLLCTYHRKDDAKKLKQMLENAGFTTEYSRRYLLCVWDEKLSEPYLRRGVIRAKKKR
jgi:hypothetical protein